MLRCLTGLDDGLDDGLADGEERLSQAEGVVRRGGLELDRRKDELNVLQGWVERKEEDSKRRTTALG